MTKSKRLPIKVANQMIEFFRRQYALGDGSYKPLGNLGMPSDMKAITELGLAKPYGGETPRVLGWYSLTEKGVEVLETYNKLGLSADSFSGYGIIDGRLYINITSEKLAL